MVATGSTIWLAQSFWRDQLGGVHAAVLSVCVDAANPEMDRCDEISKRRKRYVPRFRTRNISFSFASRVPMTRLSVTRRQSPRAFSPSRFLYRLSYHQERVYVKQEKAAAAAQDPREKCPLGSLSMGFSLSSPPPSMRDEPMAPRFPFPQPLDIGTCAHK